MDIIRHIEGSGEMRSYTEMMETLADNIYADDDDYTKRLQEAAAAFMRFDEVMDEFISEHGYTGDLTDIDEKTTFIRGKFKAANVKEPRGIRAWFSEHKTIERGSAFQLAFAFGLTVDETAELFKRICLGRCFDCHTVDEAVFYFCMRNGLTYADAIEIIEKVPKDTKGKMTADDEDILYTGNIIKELHALNTKDELVDYLTRNAAQFGYNNAAATQYIRKLWHEIADTGGLAYNDKQLKANSSVWTVYLHILGLDDPRSDVISDLNIDRSLKPILKDNKLLHPLAADSFPDREGINRILNGEHVSYERVRKLQILLLFYRFWEKKFSKRGNYNAQRGDNERCIADIHRYLLDVNYPELYPGNPYDWIFIQAIQGDSPLEEFRYFIGELFAVKSEDSIESKQP